MRIYTVNGRKVWLDKAPEGYVEPVKADKPADDIIKAEKAEPVAKAKKATANKSRKTGGNK